MTFLSPNSRPNRASCRELLRLAWPLILGQSGWTLQIIFDRVLLSRSGTEAVGASFVAVLLFWSLLTLFQYTANYSTTFVAQYTGAGQPLRVGAVVGQSLWFALMAGIGFLGLVPFTEPIVAITRHAPELQRLETIYLRCLCFSALPILITAAAGSFFAGRGDSRTVLWVNGAGQVVNGVTAVVLIFGHLGFAPMGIAGAGWATVAGNTTSAVLSLALLLKPSHVREFGNGRGWAFDRQLFRQLMRFGIPQGVGTALDTLAFTVFLLFVGQFGPSDLAATTIAFTLNLLVFLPIMGVGQAIEVLVGQYLGANRPDDAERAVWTGSFFSLAFTFLVALLYVLAPETLVWPFQTQHDADRWTEVVARVPLLLRFVAVYCLFDSLNIVFSFALRGAGDTRFVMWVGIGLSWPIMVLPSWAAAEFAWGMYWAWGFASLYIIILSATYLARFRQGHWRHMLVIERVPADKEDSRVLEQPPSVPCDVVAGSDV
jgi:MATE family multidrug resistance protein